MNQPFAPSTSQPLQGAPPQPQQQAVAAAAPSMMIASTDYIPTVASSASGSSPPAGAATTTTNASNKRPWAVASASASDTEQPGQQQSHRVGKDGEPLSAKKLRRLEKNRLSARECRRRKREATENMERQINLLEGENLRLRLQLQVRVSFLLLLLLLWVGSRSGSVCVCVCVLGCVDETSWIC
jgi:hypothetical protein